MRKITLGLVIGALVLGLAGTGSPISASILDGVLSGQNTVNTVEDEDFEYIVPNTGYGNLADALAGTNPVAGGTFIGLGTQLYTVAKFNTLSNANFPSLGLGGLNGGSYQLTAIAQIEVTSMSMKNSVEADFAFTGALPSGNALEMWEDSPINTLLDFNSGTPASHTAAATDGILMLALGDVTSDDFWTASGLVDLSLAQIGRIATYEFGLSKTAGDTVVAPLGMTLGIPPTSTVHDVVGGGSVEEVQSPPAGYDLKTNTSVSWQGVPEPASVAVWALLVGLVSLGWRRNRPDR